MLQLGLAADNRKPSHSHRWGIILLLYWGHEVSSQTVLAAPRKSSGSQPFSVSPSRWFPSSRLHGVCWRALIWAVGERKEERRGTLIVLEGRRVLPGGRRGGSPGGQVPGFGSPKDGGHRNLSWQSTHAVLRLEVRPKRVNHWSWNMFSGYKHQQLSGVLWFSFPGEPLQKSSTPVSRSHPQGLRYKYSRTSLLPVDQTWPWETPLGLCPWMSCIFLSGHSAPQCFWATGW